MTADASPGPPAVTFGGPFGSAYRWLATTLLTTLLLFVAANLAAMLLLAVGVGVPEPGPLRYGLEPLRAAYPERSDQEIRELLTEFWTRPYAYEPFTEFREDAFDGRHLHILPEGFRSAGHPQPWPPEAATPVVFVFGGSTAMGYGVGDSETLPARLEAELAAAPCGPTTVYNFARSSYFSSQERILFQQLALAGAVPDVAVFVDGLNEFAYPRGEPKFTARLTALMGESQTQLARRWFVHLPLARLVKGLQGDPESAGEPPATPKETARDIVGRWLVNKQLIEALAHSLDVTPFFVWQPVHLYGSRTPSPAPALEGHAALPYEAPLLAGYALLDQLRRSPDPRLAAPGFLWLAEASPTGQAALYVDRVHYSAAFNHYLAEQLAPAVGRVLCDPSDSAVPGVVVRP